MVVSQVVSVASSLGLLFVKEVTYNLGGQMGSFSMFEKSSAALALYFQDIKVLLLLPYAHLRIIASLPFIQNGAKGAGSKTRLVSSVQEV